MVGAVLFFGLLFIVGIAMFRSGINDIKDGYVAEGALIAFGGAVIAGMTAFIGIVGFLVN